MTVFSRAIDGLDEILVKEAATSADVRRVYQLAESSGRPSFGRAKDVASMVEASPPKEDSPAYMLRYVRDVVLPAVPRRVHYDDVFWSCLLYILDTKKIPFCSIDGPFHDTIFEIYDDFDPSDVSG